MKRLPFLLSFFIFAVLLNFSCKKDTSKISTNNAIPADILDALHDDGYRIYDARKVEGGYVVEGDIFIAEENVKTKTTSPILRIAETEQYRTTNLIGALPRNFTVSITGFDPVYTTALDIAIARYADSYLNLTIHFQRVAANGDIQIVNDNNLGVGVLGQSAGFPTAAGNLPAGQTRLSSNTIGANPDANYVASILTHEIGHDIGFRHTDLFNRAYSCGGAAANEENPPTGVGAINIYGTPTGPDANSWMLACNTSKANRPFTSYDITALRFLYASSIVNYNVGGSDSRSIGYIMHFTNTSSGTTYNFSVNAFTYNSITLGQVPSGTYNINVQPNGPPSSSATFTLAGSANQTQTGNTAYFSNISVTSPIYVSIQ